MGKKMTKFLDVITFGGVSRRANKEIKKQTIKNTELKLNSMALPNVETLIHALGGKPNISNITSTMSTIKFVLMDSTKADLEQLKRICAKGAIKSGASVTLLVGDCANALKEAILAK